MVYFQVRNARRWGSAKCWGPLNWASSSHLRGWLMTCLIIQVGSFCRAYLDVFLAPHDDSVIDPEVSPQSFKWMDCTKESPEAGSGKTWGLELLVIAWNWIESKHLIRREKLELHFGCWGGCIRGVLHSCQMLSGLTCAGCDGGVEASAQL